MSIKCLVVDDEHASQNVLKHFIQKIQSIELIGVCSDAKEAFEQLQINPDINLLFLDINMPNQSGLDFYKSIQHPPKVIFTTAYPQYAVEGFEVSAIDYLLKPISYDRFLVAIKKAIKTLNLKTTSNSYIIINENKSLHKVLIEDIEFVEAYGDYVQVYTTDKKITTLSTFKSFLKNLPPSFIRTHKSFCVNTNKIKQISGNQILLDKHKIPIGQTYRAKVLMHLE